MKRIRRLLKNFGRLLFLVKVEGESAWPELVPGKFCLASGILKPKIGDFIIFKNPKNFGQVFVKRVNKIIGNDCWVNSSVSWGSSSFYFGSVGRDLVLGKIINHKS